MTAESLTTKLARERLSAIKRFIPLRDRVRDKLQQRQESQIDFSESSEQLFAPITTATRDVKTATERAIYGDIPVEGQRREKPILGVLEKIAAETEKTQQGIKELQTQREIERLGDIDVSTETQEVASESAAMKTPRVPFKNKLTENAIEEIRRPQLEKPGDYVAFGEFAAESYHQREDFLKDEYKRSTIKRDDWADWLYKINKGTTGNLKKTC